MAAHVECIGHWNNGFPLYSIAHYYKQNGDMMKDPDMVFVKHPLGKVFPISFEQSSAGIYQESVWYDGGFKMKAKQQKDHATFANTWMKNIKEQQELWILTLLMNRLMGRREHLNPKSGGNTMKFTPGVVYETRSTCDHNCIFSHKVVKRTAKTVTIDNVDGGTARRKIIMWEGNETIFPLGKYSMAPILNAGR